MIRPLSRKRLINVLETLIERSGHNGTPPPWADKKCPICAVVREAQQHVTALRKKEKRR